MSTPTLTTSSGTTTGQFSLPRVNLLPPEIAAAKRLRRMQFGAGGAVLAAVGIVGALYVLASSDVSSAQDSYDQAQARTGSLQTQVAGLQNVRQVYAQVDAKEAMLRTAMGGEIQWSHYLVDLSLTIPDNVWIAKMTVGDAHAAPTTAAGATTLPSATATATGVPGSGLLVRQVTFDGYAFTTYDLAAWLESLAKQKGYANPWFSTAKAEIKGDRTVYHFTSTTDVSPAALSGRYLKSTGSK